MYGGTVLQHAVVQAYEICKQRRRHTVSQAQDGRKTPCAVCRTWPHCRGGQVTCRPFATTATCCFIDCDSDRE
jgi:hypothetical protein